MKTKFTFISIFLTFMVVFSAQAQWSQTAHSAGSVDYLTTIGSDVFVGNAYPSTGLYKLSNDGTTSTAMSSGLQYGTGTSVYSIIKVGSNMFAATAAGVYKSSDNGSNWSLSGLDTSLIAAITYSSGYIYAGTSTPADGIFRSGDNGSTWTSYSNGFPANSVQSMTANDNAILASVYNDVYRTVDNGANWASAINGLTFCSNTVLARNGSDLYAGGQQGYVYKSTDNGATWTSLGNAYAQFIMAFAILDTNIFVATNYGFKYSHNGSAWTDYNTGLNWTNLKAITICGSYIYIGADGGGIWKRPLSDFGISSGSGVNNVSEVNPFIVYPNPAQGFVTVNYKNMQGEIAVYDNLGQIIYKSVINEQNKTIDLSNQPKGFYIIKVSDGTKIYSQKVEIQ